MSFECSANKPVSVADVIRAKFAQDGLVTVDFIKQQLPQAEELFVFKLTSAINRNDYDSSGIIEKMEVGPIEKEFGKKYSSLLEDLKKKSPFVARFRYLAQNAAQRCFLSRCEAVKKNAQEQLINFPIEILSDPLFVEDYKEFVQSAMVFIKNPRIGHQPSFIDHVLIAAIWCGDSCKSLLQELLIYYEPFLWHEDPRVRQVVLWRMEQAERLGRVIEEGLNQSKYRDYAVEHLAYLLGNEEKESRQQYEKYKALAEKNPNEAFYHFAAGIFLFYRSGGGSDEEERAIKFFEKAVQLSPRNLAYLHRLIESLPSDDVQAEEKYLRQMARISKKNPEYYLITDDCRSWAGRMNSELRDSEILAALQERAKREFRCYDAIGDFYRSKGELKKAEEAYQKFLSKGTGFFPYWSLGEIYEEQKLYAEAVSHYRRYLEYNPANSWAWIHLGHMYFRLNRIEEGNQTLELATRLSWDDIFWLRKIAKAYEEQNQINRRNKILERIVEFKEATVDEYMISGLVYDSNQKYGEAIKLFQKVVGLEPNHGYIHHHLGVAVYRSGKEEESLVHFREAVRLNPDEAEHREWLGRVFYKLGRYQEALDVFKKAEKLFPKDKNLHRWLGEIYTGLRQYEKAFSSYQKALGLCEDDKQRSKSLELLGDLYLKSYGESKYQGDRKTGIQYYQKAIKLDSENSDLQAKLTNASKLAR